MASADLSYEELEEKIAKVQQDKRDLRKKLNEADAEAKAKRAEADALREEHKALEDTITSLKTQLASIGTSKVDLDRANAKVEELKAKLFVVEAERDLANSEKTKALTDLANAIQEREALKTQVAKISELEEALIEAEELKVQAETKVDKLEKKAKELKKNADKFKKSIEELNAQVEGLLLQAELAIDTAYEEHVAKEIAEANVLEMANEVAEFESKLNDKENEIYELQSKVSGLERDVERKGIVLDITEKELKDEREVVQVLTEEKSQLESEVLKMANEIADSENKLNGKENEIYELSAKADELGIDVEHAQEIAFEEYAKAQKLASEKEELSKSLDEKLKVSEEEFKKSKGILKKGLVTVAAFALVVSAGFGVLKYNTSKNIDELENNVLVVTGEKDKAHQEKTEAERIAEMESINAEVSSNKTAIQNNYNSVQTSLSNAEKILPYTNENVGSTYSMKEVGISQKEATGYAKVIIAGSESERLNSEVAGIIADYDTAYSNKDTAKASELASQIASYSEQMEAQAKSANQGFEEMLGNSIFADMDMAEIEKAISLMKEPVIVMDIDNSEISKHNNLFVNGGKGVALDVISCQYTKADQQVLILVRCVDKNENEYLNYISFKTSTAYNTTMDQYNVIEELKNANAKMIAYDLELDNSIEGSTITTTINGVEVSGTVDMKYSVVRDYDKKAGYTKFNASAIVILSDENGNFVGSQMFDFNDNGVKGLSMAGNVKVSVVEEQIKENLLDQIEKTLEIEVSSETEEVEFSEIEA